MKYVLKMSLAASILVSTACFANSDDLKWISQCVKDNANEGQANAVVMKYCECMNDKMPESETQSITQWEKSHPKEEAECDKVSGWKK